MSDRTDDHDWVVQLLAATESPRMPDDVAGRLDRAVRDEISGRTATGVDSAAATGAAAAGSPVPSVQAPARRPASAEPTEQPTEQPTDEPIAGPATDPGTGPAAPDDSSEPLVADPDGDGPLPSVLGGASRPWGSSRRERREEQQGERRRRALTKWAPVAAGVLLLGGAGATAVAVLGQGGDDATADSDLEAATVVEEAPPAPRALVSTGTEYSTTDQGAFAEQVRSLVAVAGSGTDAAAGGAAAASEPVEASAGADTAADPAASAAADEAVPESSALVAPEAARSAVADSPLAERTAFDECVDQVTDGSASTVAAMDLAVVDGLVSTVVVVPDAAGASYLVYVVGPDCSGIDDGLFKFFTVTP